MWKIIEVNNETHYVKCRHSVTGESFSLTVPEGSRFPAATKMAYVQAQMDSKVAATVKADAKAKRPLRLYAIIAIETIVILLLLLRH